MKTVRAGYRFSWVLDSVVGILLFTVALTGKPCFAQSEDAQGKSSGSLIRAASPWRENDPFADISFATFYSTGLEVCTSEKGLPLVLMFSKASCSHCQWSGQIFDFIVQYYVSNGLIEAHHYDLDSGDDLLTEEAETKIPPAYLEIKVHGDPKNIVPYFNFSCKYERLGTGNEKEDDTAAEGEEMRKVIDTLIRVISTSGKKD